MIYLSDSDHTIGFTAFSMTVYIPKTFLTQHDRHYMCGSHLEYTSIYHSLYFILVLRLETPVGGGVSVMHMRLKI